VRPDLGWQVMLEDEVHDRQTAARPEHAVRLGQAVAEAPAGGAEVIPAGETREDQPPPR
jgi:hypothetical protein